MQSQSRSTSSRAFAETDRWRVIRTATCPRGQDPCSFPDCVSPDFVCRRCGNTLSAATAPSSLRPGTPSRRSQALEHDEPRTHIRSIQTNRDFQRSIWAGAVVRTSLRRAAGSTCASLPLRDEGEVQQRLLYASSDNPRRLRGEAVNFPLFVMLIADLGMLP